MSRVLQEYDVARRIRTPSRTQFQQNRTTLGVPGDALLTIYPSPILRIELASDIAFRIRSHSLGILPRDVLITSLDCNAAHRARLTSLWLSVKHGWHDDTI